MESNNKRQQGHTIVEVVIALFLIAIVVPAMANLLSLIVKRSCISYSETKEALLASSQLETIKSLGFKGVSNGTGNSSEKDGCKIVWIIDKGSYEAKVFVNVFCPSHNQSRGMQLKTILIP